MCLEVPQFLWQRFKKAMGTFLWDLGPHWHEGIKQLLQLHIHDVNLIFHHIPKVLCCIDTWWMWGSFECSELTVRFTKTSWRWFEVCNKVQGVLSCWCQPSEDGYTAVIEGISHTIPLPPAWITNRRQIGSMLSCSFIPNSDPTIQMSQQKLRLIKPGNIFLLLNVMEVS